MAVPDPAPVPAGSFAEWLEGARAAIRDRAASEVPCGECTACCTASQFIAIAPDEDDTRAHVPAAVRFTAPGAPAGFEVMGFDARGWCPMFDGTACTIYDHRPRACRLYDCRVFPATGLVPSGSGQAGVAARAARWEFAFEEPDTVEADALRTAVDHLQDHPEVFGEAGVPRVELALAVAAIAVVDLFVTTDARTGEPCVGEPDPVALARRLGPPSS